MFLPKRLNVSTELYGVTSQMTVRHFRVKNTSLIVDAVRLFMAIYFMGCVYRLTSKTRKR